MNSAGYVDDFLPQMSQLEEDQIKEWEISVYCSQARSEIDDEVYIEHDFCFLSPSTVEYKQIGK